MDSFTVDMMMSEATIKFTDNLVSNTVEDLRETLKKLLSDQIDKIYMDFQSVDMIDSMGIGLLVSTHNTLTARNSELVILNLSSDLHELFSVMRLNEFFKIQ